MPAPLRKGKFLRGSWQRCYLIYTACLHGVLLILVPFTFPQYVYDESYMRGNLRLQLTFILTSITRVFAMISGGFTMWSKRKKLLECAEGTFNHWQKCKELEDHSSDYTRLRKRIRWLLSQAFFSLNFGVLVGMFILMKIDTDQSFSMMIVVHIVQFVYVGVMTAEVYVILLILHLQSERVQLALRDLCFSLHHEERNSLVLSGGKARKSLNDLRNLFQLYCDNQRLTREVFRICDLPIALLLLKMFVTNVNLVYHGVQFGNDSVEISTITKILGEFVVITHYWSAVLVMNIVDDITRRCGSKMGCILREFSDLDLVKRDFHLQVLFWVYF